MYTLPTNPDIKRELKKHLLVLPARSFDRVSGHSDLCSSRIELEAILKLRRNVPPLLS
jgi:hypothetical protein